MSDRTEQSERIPPQDLMAEQATLGGMMVEPGALERVLATGLQAAEFYQQAHMRIFDAITHLVAKGQPVDLLTVDRRLRDEGCVDAVGGPAYLSSLLKVGPTTAHIVRYAQI
ncbi:unnamed protein product, partial [marine sediment metagenome]